jgi:Tat protein translocase TatC
VYAGIFFSIPVIVYQLLKYIEPLIKKNAMRFILLGSIASGLLALAGMAFGYFFGLPAALGFLLHQFTNEQIQAMLSIQSYLSFVTVYLLGSALLFQFPLILLLINRIKPLKPKKLLGYERWVIVGAFILGGVMNPSPRVVDQLILTIPIILTYQLGIGLIWLANRREQKRPAAAMLKKDAELQAERLMRFREAQATIRQDRADSVQQPQVVAFGPAIAQRQSVRPVRPRATAFPMPARRQYFDVVYRPRRLTQFNQPSQAQE